MFSLLGKSRALGLPVDIQLDLFNVLVMPILSYGSEVWGYTNLDIIDKFILKYCKYVLHVRTTTSTVVLRGELGLLPARVNIWTGMITFWCDIIKGKQNKLCKVFYDRLLYAHKEQLYSSHIEKILNDCGFLMFGMNRILEVKYG